MELKTHSIVKITVEKNLELKRRFIEVYEVHEAYPNAGVVVLRRIRVESEHIEQCPTCGIWHYRDEEAQDEADAHLL